jgi:hypothetical protein
MWGHGSSTRKNSTKTYTTKENDIKKEYLNSHQKVRMGISHKEN